MEGGLMLSRRATVVVLWLVSMFIAGVLGYAQTPLPPRAPRSTEPPTVISGNDLGFRVDARKGNTPLGRFVVRVDGQWVEIEESASVRRVTVR
jgi:hypothetical protein